MKVYAAIFALTGVCAAISALGAPIYSAAPIRVDPSVGNGTPVALNDAGEVAGDGVQRRDAGRALIQAFRWTLEGGIVWAPMPEKTMTTVVNIDRRGTVYGLDDRFTYTQRIFAWRSDGTGHIVDQARPIAGNASGDTLAQDYDQGYFWKLVTKDGRSRQLDIPAGAHPVGLNDHRDVVGDSGTGTAMAMLWRSDGRVENIGRLPGSDFTVARAVNNTGTVVGYGYVGSLVNPVPYRWTATEGMVELPLPDGCTGGAEDINDSGTIVGTITCGAEQASAAVVWPVDGGVYRLDERLSGEVPLDQIDSQLGRRINASGQILVTSSYLTRGAGALLTPVADD